MGSLRRATSIAAAALLAIAPGVAISGGSRLAALSVRVEVKPSAAFKLELKTAQLAISDADVALGYVDLPASTRLSVSTGRFRPAVLLDFSPGMGPFKSVEVSAEDAGYAAEKTAHGAATTVTGLSFRLGLSSKAAPGPYRLPLILNVDL
jgi:hypothetical protein